jgi:hypothetical protein
MLSAPQVSSSAHLVSSLEKPRHSSHSRSHPKVVSDFERIMDAFRRECTKLSYDPLARTPTLQDLLKLIEPKKKEFTL